MQRRFAGGPELNAGWTIAELRGGRVYKRCKDGWHRLDNRAYSNVEEMMASGS